MPNDLSEHARFLQNATPPPPAGVQDFAITGSSMELARRSRAQRERREERERTAARSPGALAFRLGLILLCPHLAVIALLRRLPLPGGLRARDRGELAALRPEAEPRAPRARAAAWRDAELARQARWNGRVLRALLWLGCAVPLALAVAWACLHGLDARITPRGVRSVSAMNAIVVFATATALLAIAETAAWFRRRRAGGRQPRAAP